MSHQKITKAQAVALALHNGWDCAALVRDAAKGQDDASILMPFGVKLYISRKGKKVIYTLSGYANDGSDLRKALELIACS